MNTECRTERVEFQPSKSRKITAAFDGGTMTSDGGVLLLRELEQKHRIIARLARWFVDHRDPDRIEHSVEELLAQRIFGLICGYPDLNDQNRLRYDPAMAAAVGKEDPSGASRPRRRDMGAALASSATLNRLELSAQRGSPADRYARIECDMAGLENELIDLVLESIGERPEQIILDADATDFALHGDQEGRFFHGYYDHYCYLPLYVFAGPWLMAARLRRANIDASKGVLELLEVIVTHLRRHFGEKVPIVLRADSGFARDHIFNWCDQWEVDYVVGLAQNVRLRNKIAPQMLVAKARHILSEQPERVFADFQWTTRSSWTCKRRVIGKAEYLDRGANPRFVVTSLEAEDYDAKTLYETLYCARGDAENRIADQMELFGDQMSTHWMQSNQLRLLFASVAYLFVCLLRRAAECVGWERLRPNTLRVRLMKIGAQVRITVRRIWLKMSSTWPWQREFVAIAGAIRAGP